MCRTFRRLAPLFALAAVAYPATIIEGGLSVPTPVAAGGGLVPVYVTSFDTHLGVLNSAVIHLILDADFQASVLALPAPPFSPPVDTIGYTATTLPGLLAIGGTPIAGVPNLQSAAITVAAAGGVTTLSTVSIPQQSTASVPSLLLSSIEEPAAGILIPIQLLLPGLTFEPTTPQTIILSDFATVEADYVSVTYNYTPFRGSPAPTAAPEPMSKRLVMGALLLGFFLCRFSRNFSAS